MLTPWVAENRVWENEEGFYISSMTCYEDLEQEGRLQGHCGGSHFRFIDAKVTYLYSLRDKDVVPKATIHFKPVEFLNKKQPLDEFPNDQAHGNPDPRMSYRFLKSTTYDVGGRNGKRFMWEGRECVILSVSGRVVWAPDGKGKAYKEYVDAWVDSHPVKPKAKAITA